MLRECKSFIQLEILRENLYRMYFNGNHTRYFGATYDHYDSFYTGCCDEYQIFSILMQNRFKT